MGRGETETHGYLSVMSGGDTPEERRIGDGIGVYREEARTARIHIRTDGEDTDLGFSDVTVSRLREDGPPVRFYESDGGVYVENVDNTSRVTVEYVGATRRLEAGERERLDRDCEVTPGSETSFRVSVESVANDDRPAAADTETVSTAGDGELPVSAVVSLNCEGFAGERSRHEALLYGQRLLDVVREHPVDTPQYDEAVERLERRVEQLRTLDATELGDERRQYNERVADRIGRLYVRSR